MGLICSSNLGTPVVPFLPFDSGVSLLQLKIRKKGTFIIKLKGFLGNLVECALGFRVCS